MTITGLSNVAPGEYYIGIKGTSATETETRFKTLKIYNATFQNVIQTTPANAQNGLSTSVNLKWENQSQCGILFRSSIDSPAFTLPTIDTVVTTNEFVATGLARKHVTIGDCSNNTLW